jgi:hypothetical protein
VLDGSEGSPSEMGLGSAAATPLWRRQEVSGGVSRIDATLHQRICVIRTPMRSAQSCRLACASPEARAALSRLATCKKEHERAFEGGDTCPGSFWASCAKGPAT